MNFYENIVKSYDDIFPVNPHQIKFINGLLKPGSSILEVGSATGNLSFGLAKSGQYVIGIELDKAMVEVAESRNSESNSVKFEPLDLRFISERFSKSSFDSVICVGNTLVHIMEMKSIQDFFKNSHNILKPEGKLILQIINYDRILRGKLKGLPFIENDKIKFERYYDYKPEDRAVNFRTVLTIKSSGEVLYNNIQLLALRKHEIEEMIKTAGFSKLDFFCNWIYSPFNQESLPLILVATK